MTSAGRAVAMAAVAGLLLAGCAGRDATTDGRPMVVTTTTILGDVVARSVGEFATVEVLMPPGADPHDFRPSPRQAQLIRDADLVVANGLGLEESLSDVLETAETEGARVLELAGLLDPIPLSGDHESHGSEGGEHGHGAEDPHFWHDPVRMAQAVKLVADSLEELDPSIDWRAGADEYASTLIALDAEIVEVLEPVPPERRKLVTGHESFGYFADRYGFENVGALVTGGSTLAEPSAAHLVELAERMEAESVRAVFVEAAGPTDLAEALAREVDGEVTVHLLHSESLAEESGAGTYVDMLRSNARTIAGALA